MKNCRQHILNNHRSVSFRLTRGRTQEMCFPKSYQIKKPFEFQRVNKKQQPYSHLHCAQRTVRQHVPQAGLFSATSASYQKNTMFRVPSWFTNMKKMHQSRTTEPLRTWQLLPGGTVNRGVHGYNTTWHVAGQSLHCGPENHRSLVDYNLINHLSGCFYVGPALYAFIFSI